MENLWGNGRISRPEVFCKKGAILEISQNSQETPVPEHLFNKVAGLGPLDMVISS